MRGLKRFARSKRKHLDACPQKRVVHRKTDNSSKAWFARTELFGSGTGRGFSSLKIEYAGCRCRFDMSLARSADGFGWMLRELRWNVAVRTLTRRTTGKSQRKKLRTEPSNGAWAASRISAQGFESFYIGYPPMTECDIRRF